MYKVASLGLVVILAVIIIPSSDEIKYDEGALFGHAEIIHRDSAGNILSEESIHNILTDEGEHYLAARNFWHNGLDSTGNNFISRYTQSNNALINTICITNESSFTSSETKTGSNFNTGNSIVPSDGDDGACINQVFTVPAVPDTKLNNNNATITVIFTSGNHFDSGTTITGIGVCSENDTQTLPSTLDNCVVGSSNLVGKTPLVANIDISDVTPTGTDTLTVTYTMVFE